MYLTYKNLELQTGFDFKVKKNQGKWNPNQGDKYSLVTMMNQTPSNIIMRWYTLHGDERESAQNTKQGSSALEKNPKTPNTHSPTHTHTITILVQEFGAFDIEKYHLCSQKSQ